MTELTWVC